MSQLMSVNRLLKAYRNYPVWSDPGHPVKLC